jgi:antitoxin VapB
VRLALQHELERSKPQLSLAERLAPALAIADAMGPTNPGFDQKKVSDELWGE